MSDFTIENGVLTAYKGESKNVVIPDGVKVIGDGSPVFGNMVESVTIPTSATEIAEMAFYGCSALKSVTFAEESQLKKIGESAFYTATSLETLTIPEGVTEIGTNAFYATHALREINLPASLTTVCGGDWFGKLFTFGTTAGAPQSLSAVNFADGNSVYSSHDGVVYSADGKTLIYCPAKKTSIDWLAGVETIKTDSFFRSTIADLQIPEGVTTIEENAFKFCAATSAIFPSTLKSIGRMAFYSSKLNSIIFSEGLETIAASAFDEVYFSKDGSITLPASLISVGSSAFGCVTDSGKKVAVTVLGSGTELGSYFIPNSGNITLVGYPGSTAEAYANALGDNKNLTFKLIGGSEEKEIESVTLPTTLELRVGETSTLTASVLPKDASDKTLTWSSSDENVATVDENGKVTAVKAGNAVITATASNNVSASCELTVAEISDFTITDGVLTGYTGSAKNVVIPDGVKVIGEGSSVFGNNIESVTIPASVTEIADYAFNGCAGLKSVTFADGSQLNKIGGSAFYAANSLESLTIPESVTEIGIYAFCAMSRLRTISLPASLKNVCGGEWFGNLFARGTYGAPESLINVNIMGEGRYASYDGAVYSSDNKTLIYCPAAKKSLNFADGVETIGEYAFCNSRLTSVTIPGNGEVDSCERLQPLEDDDCRDSRQCRNYRKLRVLLFKCLESDS
ncbi:MAG: leucine-rich repeat protein [Eubacteriales bacterium]